MGNVFSSLALLGIDDVAVSMAYTQVSDIFLDLHIGARLGEIAYSMQNTCGFALSERGVNGLSATDAIISCLFHKAADVIKKAYPNRKPPEFRVNGAASVLQYEDNNAFITRKLLEAGQDPCITDGWNEIEKQELADHFDNGGVWKDFSSITDRIAWRLLAYALIHTESGNWVYTEDECYAHNPRMIARAMERCFPGVLLDDPTDPGNLDDGESLSLDLGTDFYPDTGEDDEGPHEMSQLGCMVYDKALGEQSRALDDWTTFNEAKALFLGRMTSMVG